MKSIRTEITVNAPAQVVWNLLTDFDRYKTWNPFMQISGTAKQGNRLKITIFLEGQKPQAFQPVILECIPGKSFRWLGSLFIKGLFDGEHFFQLEPVSENKTRFIHGENFSGLLSGLILKLIREKTTAGFEKMNKGLKQEAERQAVAVL